MAQSVSGSKNVNSTKRFKHAEEESGLKKHDSSARFKAKAKQNAECFVKQKGDSKGILVKKEAEIGPKLHPVSQHTVFWKKNKLHAKSDKVVVNGKKTAKDDPAPSDVPTKKRKKVMRIDPYDISDKRIDDSASSKEEESGLKKHGSSARFKAKAKQNAECFVKQKGDSKGIMVKKEAEIGPKLHPVSQHTVLWRKNKLHAKSNKVVVNGKKTAKDDPAPSDVPTKKRKKAMRIDPYDISNKRIDDSASSKENVEDEEIKLSKNAQFRAIKPTPAILSFVEDNLLGRRRLIELRNAGYDVKLSAPLDNVPFSTSSERERIEENVFRNKLEFFAAAKISSSFPPSVLPEIAFAGRSNVGKSSLLNALTRQWGVVRTSDKPGLTQTINFFRLASKLCLVDLPGYGFAYAKEEVKDAWEELVKEYVSTREGLKRVCLLIDTKWGMKPRDHELIDLMERSQTSYQIVLTKTDMVFPMDVARRAMQIEENLKANKSVVSPLMMASSKSGAGIRSLRTVLAKIARFVKP